jgi:hypothetical protein
MGRPTDGWLASTDWATGIPNPKGLIIHRTGTLGGGGGGQPNKHSVLVLPGRGGEMSLGITWLMNIIYVYGKQVRLDFLPSLNPRGTNGRANGENWKSDPVCGLIFPGLRSSYNYLIIQFISHSQIPTTCMKATNQTTNKPTNPSIVWKIYLKLTFPQLINNPKLWWSSKV